VHRLDNPTTGILLVAKTSRAAKKLGQQFENKTIRKTYRALVQGTIDKTGVINSLIEKQEALTEYKRLSVSSSLANTTLSDVELYPKTGRTHQLRIHMASIGHAIIGDSLYGIEGKTLKHKGLFLYAVGLVFYHPVSSEKISLTMNLPEKYQVYLNREKARWEKFNT
jgi:23S rRNA-/tRNA-specific pseudouridylate synthase